MTYLVDTNVLSELRRERPDDRVRHWFVKRPSAALYLSVLTFGEIRKGIEALKDVDRRLPLLDWLETELPRYFAGRILAVDAPTADRWRRLLAAAGRPLPVIDSLLVATAAQHGLMLVTRNVRDVDGLGVPVIDLWAPGA